jgi:hypothetical protein
MWGTDLSTDPRKELEAAGAAGEDHSCLSQPVFAAASQYVSREHFDNVYFLI